MANPPQIADCLITCSADMENEFHRIKQQIEDEINKGIIPDPSTVDPITGQPLPQPAGAGMEGMGADPMAMGEVPAEPDLEAEAQAVDAQYQKDTRKAEL